MKNFIFLSFLSFLFFSCTTTSAVNKFYSEWKSVDLISTDCKLSDEEEPNVFYSDDINSDIYYLRSNYYYIIGNSAWNGPAKGNNLKKEIIEKCKELGSKVALYTWNYTDTKNGAYSVPHTNYNSYTDSNGFVRSYTTTSYSTNYYSIDRYDYDVYFFVPYEDWYIKRPKLGIETRDLNSDDRMNFHRDTGVYIAVVYENSPAFYANITRGDIITKINDRNVITSQDYYDALESIKAGDIVKVAYSRNGIENKIEIKIF